MDSDLWQPTTEIDKLIQKIGEKLKSMGVDYDSVKPSSRKNKKIQVTLWYESKMHTVHFGDKHSQTYLEGASKQKRDAYRARHSKILLKDGTRAIDSKYSPAWFSYHLLW